MPKTIPARINFILAGAILCASLAQLLVMPLVMPSHALAMISLSLMLIPLNTPFWSLIHEAVHRNFHPNVQVNEWSGRIMSIVFGASFDVLRFGHLMHHQYNREWESEIYKERHNRLLFVLNHYFKMLGGLYVTEILVSFLIAISPSPIAHKIARASFTDIRHQQAVLTALLKPRVVNRLRLDCALIVLLHVWVFWAFGANWPVALFIIAGRALIISLMDNAYHYGTPGDNSVIAKELRVPVWCARFILNFNHHETHHRNTALPWTDLKSAHDMQGISYTEGLASALFAQFKGPIKHIDPA
jgi:fatty acid desaturase